MEKIALLPGGFKPPHAGHYNMAKWLAANTDADSVVIKVGSKERDGITRDISLELWDLYRKADEDSNKLVIVPSEQNSPVRDVYDFIEQEAPEGSTIYLGMGEKDEEDQRFQNIGKFAEPKGIEFKTILVPPQAGGVSGTEMRGFISDSDKDSFQKYLPDHLSSEQKDKAWEIVTTKPEIEEDFYSPENKTVDFMRSSEWKAGYRGKKDIPRKGDQIHNRQKTRGVVYEQVYIPEDAGCMTFCDPVDFSDESNLLGEEQLLIIPICLPGYKPDDSEFIESYQFMIGYNNDILQWNQQYSQYVSQMPQLFGLPNALAGGMGMQTENQPGVVSYAFATAEPFDWSETAVLTYLVFVVTGNGTANFTWNQNAGGTDVNPNMQSYYVYGVTDCFEDNSFSVGEEEDICDNYPEACCAKCATGNVAEDDPCYPYCDCCPEQDDDEEEDNNVVPFKDPGKAPLKDKPKKEPIKKPISETRGGESEFHIYDFDETIARSLTPIPYEILSPEGIKTGEGETTSKDFEKDQEELHNLHGKNNVIFNFKAFEKQIENAIINDSIFNKLIKSLEDPNVKTTILTARTVGQPVTRFLKNVGLDAYVEALGVHKQGEKVTGQDKADWIEKRLKKTTKKIYFVDDSESNRSAVSLLQDKYPEVKFEIEDPPEIEDEEKVDEMMAGTMNKQEKRKHKRKLKKIKKGLKKYNKKNRYFEVPKNWRGSLTRKSKTRKTRRKKLNENNTISTALINDIPIPLETMNTHEQQIRGMMGRDSLEGGMLFPYDNIQKRDFHMEGCKIPLDIIFITQDKINKIHHDCPPCKTNNCPQYSGRADNVLELPGGFCKKNNINQGDNINLNINPNIPEPKIEENVFTKVWWKDIINEMLLKEGGAAGHMAHPFNLSNVNSGRDLLDIFQKSSDSLQNNPGSVKIDGVNSSIRLVDIDGEKQFVMDRGSKKELDIKGITKADLEDRFGAGHGMIKIGGEVLDMFNEALPSLQSDLEELGAWDDPNILFNMEYVSGKTNVQDYGSNFIAIHGLNKIESKEVQGKRKMLTQRSSTEISYSKDALQSLLDNLAPIAKEKDFEVHGSVPTTMDKDPNFNSALSKTYTIEAGENTQTKSLKDLLNELNNIPEEDFIFMNIDGSQKKVGAVSKQVYLAILEGKNINELFDDEEDRQKAIEGFTTYLATEKLGDEILKVLNSPMGSVEDHEGVVIRDENIADVPFKITGKFILGGLVSDF